MIDILLTIIAFNILIVFFKLFHKYHIDNLQALIVNYFVAGSLSLYFSNQDFSINHIINSPWIFHAIIVGILFIVTFNLYATGTQKVGIAITTIANKLSLLIPVGIALIVYPNEKNNCPKNHWIYHGDYWNLLILYATKKNYLLIAATFG